MQWTIQDLGAVGEFVSSIAVLVTLIYLAVQTHQTQKLVRGQTRQAFADSTQFALLTNANSDYLPAIAVKLEAAGFPDDPRAIDVLDATEQLRYRNYLLGNTHRIRSHLYHVTMGLADRSLAPPRGTWEPRLRAFGLDDSAADLEALYEAIEQQGASAR